MGVLRDSPPKINFQHAPCSVSEMMEQTRISFRSKTPRDANSDSGPGLLRLKRHLGTRSYTLNGGFTVFRVAFPHFNKYQTYPPGYYAK